MLKLFDKNHNAIGHLVKYKDCKKESDVSTGDATLSFTYLAKNHRLETEMYIQTQEDEYVIKEISESSDGFPQIVAALNLEELEAKPWQEFSVTDATIDEAARVALAGTGWTVGKCNVTKRRNTGMVQMTSLGVVQNLCTAFMCEVVFDTIEKKVSFYEKRGEEKGVYFLAGLNLKKLQKKSSSYDFYTRIIPIGAEGLTIEEANGGKDYLENHQYSDKIKTYIWQDESYTDAQALKEDAELKLNDLSKPEKSFSAQVRDLARQKAEYSILSYKLGDTIKIIDPGTGTMEDQRIVRMTEYEDDPEKNTCEIANTFLTFEEMQQKLRDAAAIVNHTISSDGKIKVSDILKFEQGIADSPIVSDMAGNITTMQGDLAAVKTTIGQIETNYLKADEASIKYATIENLTAVNETVHSIQGDYADFKTLTAQEIAATNARIDNINAGTVTTEYLKANYASIDLANVETASVGELLARTGVLTDMTVVNGYVTGQLNGVRINADVITAGTLSVDRLMVTGEDSIVYQINVASSGLSMQELEDEKYQKYLNGTDIVAASITGDRIAGNTITGNHIMANSITGDCIKANTINGSRIVANSITSNEINVNDLFAQDITATGTIRGVTLQGTKGVIGGWSINETELLNTNSYGNNVKISNGTNANQDILVVRTGSGTASSPYEYPVIIRADGKASFSNAEITGDITSTKMTACYAISMKTFDGVVGKLFSTGESIDARNTIFFNFDNAFDQLNLYVPFLWCTGAILADGSIRSSANLQAPSIELSAKYPYIDFHFDNSTEDYTSRIWESSYKNININGVDFRSSTVYSANWFRSIGNTGWINETRGGGWWMTDDTWIRSFGGKNIYHDVGIMRTDGILQVGNNGAYFNANSAGASFGVNLTLGSHNLIFNNAYGIQSGGHWVIRQYTTSADNKTVCIGCGNASQPLRLFTTNSRVWLHNGNSYFAITSGSDRRLKKDFSEITEAYEKMYMDVDVSAFRYILDDDAIHYGFMAQDVEAALRKNNLPAESNLYGVCTAENNEAAVIHDTNVYHVNYLEWVPLNKHMITKTIRRLDMLEADTETKFNMLSSKTDSAEHRLAEITEELARMQAENQAIKTELEQLKQQRVSVA